MDRCALSSILFYFLIFFLFNSQQTYTHTHSLTNNHKIDSEIPSLNSMLCVIFHHSIINFIILCLEVKLKLKLKKILQI